MKIHEFTLILTAEPNQEKANRLYSVVQDGTIAPITGGPQISFHSAALSLEEAIGTALANVRNTGFDAVRVEIEPQVLASGNPAGLQARGTVT